MALQLLRKHNALGHPSRSALRCVLQQSHVKNERELARHVDLMPICNYCLYGKNKRNGKHKLAAATPTEPTKFMQNMAVDLSGRRNFKSSDGYWYSKFFISFNSPVIFSFSPPLSHISNDCSIWCHYRTISSKDLVGQFRIRFMCMNSNTSRRISRYHFFILFLWLVPVERLNKQFQNLFYQFWLEKTILLIYKTLKLDQN